jgi:hypothetical protein
LYQLLNGTDIAPVPVETINKILAKVLQQNGAVAGDWRLDIENIATIYILLSICIYLFILYSCGLH